MKTRVLVLGVAGLWLATSAAAREGERLQPGLWQVTATVEMPGTTSPPPTTQTQCLSQDEVDADPAPGFSQGACQVTDVHRTGAKTTWKVDCGALGKGQGEVAVQSSTSYDGSMTLETAGVVIRTSIRARRLGKC